MKRKNLLLNNISSKILFSNKFSTWRTSMTKLQNRENIYFFDTKKHGVDAEVATCFPEHQHKWEHLGDIDKMTISEVITEIKKKGIKPILSETYVFYPEILRMTFLEVTNLDSFDWDLFENVALSYGYALENAWED